MKILYWKNEEENICRAGDNYQVIIDRFTKDQEYKIIDDSELPDEYFRNAWTYDLTIDLDKAKEIQKDRIRVDREKVFTELDYQFMKALEESVDYSDITKQKQELRDLPQKVDVCKTLDEIKSVTI